MSTLETFTQTGFQAALIQKKEDISNYLNVTWTFLIIRGILLYVILYILAPYASNFFNSPGATLIIRFIGLSVLFTAFNNIYLLKYEKEIEFRKLFLYDFIGSLVEFLVTVLTALILKNVWALVFGLVAGSFVRCFMSYILYPKIPKINFDVEKIMDIFKYGKWVLASSILLFLSTQGDDILVGKLLGTTMLGYYQMAYRISNMPATEITHMISKVAFPFYAKLQDDTPSLRNVYLKTLKSVLMISSLITGVIYVSSENITNIFFGENWMPMIQIIQILVFAGLLRSITATAGSLFYASGKPMIDTYYQIVRLITMLILIYCFLPLGILGISFAVIGSLCITAIGFFKNVLNILQDMPKSIFKILTTPLVSLGFSIIVTELLGNKMFENSIVSLISLVIFYVVTYLSIYYLMGKYIQFLKFPNVGK